MRIYEYIFMSLLFCSSCAIHHDEAVEYVMSNSDASKVLNADSVSLYSDAALQVWEAAPWANLYNKTAFMEYILPPYAASEPMEFYWRTDIPKKLRVESGDDMSELASGINDAVYVNMSTGAYGNDMLGYSRTIGGAFGKCNDRSMLVTMAMRAYGIPSSYDEIPYWGSSNNGHTASSVLMPDGSISVFQNIGDRADSAIFTNKIPKVYSRRYSILKDELYRHKTESVPEFFKDFRKLDVTAKYPISTAEVVVEVDKARNSSLAYLAVFSPEGWVIVDYSEIRHGKAVFDAVGTGLSKWGANPVAGDDVGNGIIYLPCSYIKGAVEPIHDVILVSEDGITSVRPNKDKCRTVRLTRKYPLLDRIKGYVSQMNGGVFECANKPDFSDAAVMFRVDNAEGRMQLHNVAHVAQYIRFRKPRGVLSIAEMKVLETDGKELKADVFAEEFMNDIPDLYSVADDDPLTYLTLPSSVDLWVGLKLRQRTK